MSVVLLSQGIYQPSNTTVADLVDREAVTGEPQAEDREHVRNLLEQDGRTFLRWSDPAVIDLLVEDQYSDPYFVKSKYEYAITGTGNGPELSLNQFGDYAVLYCGWGQVPDGNISLLKERGDFYKLIKAKGYIFGANLIEQSKGLGAPRLSMLTQISGEELQRIGNFLADATRTNGEEVPFRRRYVGPEQIAQAVHAVTGREVPVQLIRNYLQ